MGATVASVRRRFAGALSRYSVVPGARPFLRPPACTRQLRERYAEVDTVPSMSTVDTPVLPEPPAVEARRSGPRRPVLAWLGLLAVLASAVVGSNVFSVRDHIFGTV